MNDSKAELITEFLVLAIAIGFFVNLVANWLGEYISPIISLSCMIIFCAIYMVLKLDLHKKHVEVKPILKKIAKFAVVAALIFTITLVVAQTINNFYPGIITVTEDQLLLYLDTVPFASGETIDWGNCTYGETVQISNMTVYNPSYTNTYTVQWIVTGLPAGFNVTWAGNNTVLGPTSSVSAPYIIELPTSGSDLLQHSFDQHLIG